MDPYITAIPTDTVYGLGIDIHSADAAEALRTLKGRPDHMPFVILGATYESLKPFLAADIPESIRAFWPGPLTVVVEASEKVPDWIRSGLPTVGVRIPDHPLALEYLEERGPQAVTSANLTGQPPAQTAEEVRSYFGHEFPLLDGGPCPVGVASTVAAIHPLNIFREGSVTKEQLETALANA